MKIGIIGAGNMGGAIARGLAAGKKVATADISLSSPNRRGELDAIKAEYDDINVTLSNAEAATGADVVIVAVKPWLLDEVMSGLEGVIDYKRQMLVSIVAGVTLDRLVAYAGSQAEEATVFQLIPNTAISVHQSMTFIAHRGATQSQLAAVEGIFGELGQTMVVDERVMPACTALASCGIAYVMRYIRAASEGGVELGLPADTAKQIVMQTMAGAVALLRSTGGHPEAEIDKVTTPGGLTIKGLNAMEAGGFTSSVVSGLKASVK